MKWEDVGIVLSVRKFSERDGTLTLLTRDHGVWRALVKGAFSSRQRPSCEPGNLLLARWNARLPEHMGHFSCELLEANAALMMQQRQTLLALSALCSLLEYSIHERDPHPELFARTRLLLQEMRGAPPAQWLPAYVLYERDLLAETGFGLDLSCCAATGSTENLIYISPKTGRAVCEEAGKPYHPKMLPLPAFLRQEKTSVNISETLDGLRVCGYFLEQWLYMPNGKRLPDARIRLQEQLEASPEPAA